MKSSKHQPPNKRNLIEFSVIIAVIACSIFLACMRIGDNTPAAFLFAGVLALIWKIIEQINKSN
jgi:hypothetical protein